MSSNHTWDNKQQIMADDDVAVIQLAEKVRLNQIRFTGALSFDSLQPLQKLLQALEIASEVCKDLCDPENATQVLQMCSEFMELAKESEALLTAQVEKGNCVPLPYSNSRYLDNLESM